MSLQIIKMPKIRQYKLSLLFLCSSILLSCGGKGVTVADGGISGTGITFGRITKFGSIYVNGVRFNVDNATFTRDGIPSKGQSEFSIGEYIMIRGSFDINGTGGKAVEVSFKDILEGVVTEISSDNAMLEVLGQVVKIDKLTALLGFTALNKLAAGNIVEVSGFKDAEGLINATSIKLKQTNFVVGISENELKGTISDVNAANKTIMIGNILVDYSTSILKGFNGESLKQGQLVEVKSNSEIIGSTLKATTIELEDKKQNITSNINLEVEGIVTRFVSLLDFDVNGIAVTTNTNTIYEKGNSADIELNSVLEVKGKVNSLGILVAKKIEIEKSKSENSDSDEDSNDDNENEKNNSDNDAENDDSDDVENNDSDDDSENNDSNDDSENDDSNDDSENNDSNDDSENDDSNDDSENNDSNDDSENNDSNDDSENNDSDDDSGNKDSHSENGGTENSNPDSDNNDEPEQSSNND